MPPSNGRASSPLSRTLCSTGSGMRYLESLAQRAWQREGRKAGMQEEEGEGEAGEAAREGLRRRQQEGLQVREGPRLVEACLNVDVQLVGRE